MPELPEVQTTVIGLQKHVVGLTITDIWSDLPKKTVTRPDFKETIKYSPYFLKFKRNVIGQKITGVYRRAKNILIDLSNGETILIHMKMTGHLLYGNYVQEKKEWVPSEKEKNDALRDPFNKWIHLVFTLSNKKQLVLSDLRKFATVTLLTEKHLKDLGPEPLEDSFDYKTFKAVLLRRPNGKIKQVLMDPKVIAGIGNIYSDEALWLANIHPLSRVGAVPEKQLKKLFTEVQNILKKGIDFGGDSTSDYRQLDGTPGSFHHRHNAYRKTKESCAKRGCSGTIVRIALANRGAHFCNKHQELYI